MANQTPAPVPKLSIEAIQTVTPVRITEQRQTRQVLAGDGLVGPGIFQSCFNMVQYYTQEREEDSGWHLAGWIKETLGIALMEQPMICGRLRKGEKNKQQLEIVSNDSGIRLIEARIQIKLSEFLESKQREDVEAQLVFWKDIDEHNPQFSPLFYVQVTNFECCGYSIGISCSILLTDLLLKKGFLKTWADIHNNVISNNNNQKSPLFYLPGLKSTNGSSPDLITSTSSKNSAKTMIFTINTGTGTPGSEWCRKMALACLEEAENNLASVVGGEFCLILNESLEVIKVESCSKQGVLMGHDKEMNHAGWDDLGANALCFGDGNKPAPVSCWLTSMLGAFVILIPTTSTTNVIVTIPNDNTGKI
ncbi:FAD/NAD(P)-binding oxidoreductase family protein isoform 1 [Hibiscus syriacus]|uniref:FAD/NAD(P)-binding oxidoreductase family protein isoform 1 n=1 Tax=Hibiscus syriacus TaxID=106335 RepID=A0A6A3AD01_HIBSY|nr:uncharacterized protein LOC120129028 [Hibiscus syriacus]KAE8702431.1 FAD/NAD(P)-binding oxidoreductase family protein isoform 1 [Hibiscus syriacus]